MSTDPFIPRQRDLVDAFKSGQERERHAIVREVLQPLLDAANATAIRSPYNPAAAARSAVLARVVRLIRQRGTEPR